ncbi:hypothetical protein BJF90_10455 [Pseudonocardia sp. CNS-004]|nr:hypothetical protein BJF90_10455 [Pseudonocardia sp. CNS-004]
MILVTGATGTIGASVVSGLIDGGMEFRATTRRDALLGSEQFLVRMDLADRDSVVAALAGVDVVFLNSSQHPEMAAHQAGLIDAAAGTGVRHIVKVSAGSAATGPDKASWVGRAHAAIEARLHASGLGWTVLRPNYFMQNLLGLAPAISGGTLPMALDDHRLALVDARDIAAAATAVLRDPLPHHARAYEMTGPESLTPPTSRMACRPVWDGGSPTSGSPSRNCAPARHVREHPSGSGSTWWSSWSSMLVMSPSAPCRRTWNG